jgi:ferredoxin
MSRRHEHRLTVDPIACRAHGLCSELLPELIELDEWGYPLISKRPIGAGLLPEVRVTVAACPTLALRLTEASA